MKPITPEPRRSIEDAQLEEHGKELAFIDLGLTDGQPDEVFLPGREAARAEEWLACGLAASCQGEPS